MSSTGNPSVSRSHWSTTSETAAVSAPVTVREPMIMTRTTQTTPSSAGYVLSASTVPCCTAQSPPPRPAMPADTANIVIRSSVGLTPIDSAAVSLPRNAAR